MEPKRIAKTLVRIFLVIAALVILAFVGLIIYFKLIYSSEAPKESYYVEALPVERDHFQNDFLEIAEIVKDNYLLGESKHLSLDSLCGSYAERIKGISTPREYGELLQEFFASLKVGHSFVYLKKYSAGMVPVFINDSVFINKPSQILTDAGLIDKDRVIAVEGEPVVEWINRNEKYVSASTSHNRRLFAAINIFNSLSDTVRNITVCRGIDTIKVELPMTSSDRLPSIATAKTSSKILNDSIGYIAINTMMDGVVESFTSDFNIVRNLPNLIIDVRNNERGNSGNGRELCRYFIRHDQPHCVDHKIMSPMDNAYKGKVVLLTGPMTFSAAESFVIDMKESGNVILVGEPTAGDTGNHPRTFSTSNGICFRIPTAASSVSPKGFPMEGVGIAPDHHITQTVSDYFNDKDTQLDYAVDLFRNR